jgi:DnaJ-class molecular chaperone
MRCENCHGQGHKDYHVCMECHGSGITSCCEGNPNIVEVEIKNESTQRQKTHQISRKENDKTR